MGGEGVIVIVIVFKNHFCICSVLAPVQEN